MEDFMTHRDTTIYPSARLNLILGPNGTGKSSFVAALALGLGGKTTVMERASEFAAYIRHTAPTARISIDIVDDVRKGHKTTIQHQFTRVSHKCKHTWKLNGKSVQLKHVQAKVASYGIRVDNLCQFLPQEKISKFTTLDARELLVETEKALAASSEFDAGESSLAAKAEDEDEDEGQDGDDSSAAAASGSGGLHGKTLYDEHRELINMAQESSSEEKELQQTRKEITACKIVVESLGLQRERQIRMNAIKDDLKLLERLLPLIAMQETQAQHIALKEKRNVLRAQSAEAFQQLEDATIRSSDTRKALEACNASVQSQKGLLTTLDVSMRQACTPVHEAAAKARTLRVTLAEQLRGKEEKEHALEIAQAQLAQVRAQAEEHLSVEEHTEALVKIRKMVHEKRAELTEAEAAFDAFAIKKSNLREASRDASIELQQVEAYDGKTMENLQIKAGTNLTAATTVAGMQQITKIKGLDRRPDTIAFPIMDHIRIDHNMLCERAGLAPDAPDDRLQKAQSLALRMFESVMAVGDLTSAVVATKEQWQAIAAVKLEFAFRGGQAARRIGVIDTLPEPFLGGEEGAGGGEEEDGSGSGSGSAKGGGGRKGGASAAAAGAAVGDQAPHDSFAAIPGPLADQLRAIGFSTAWEEIFDGHPLARGVLRDKLSCTIVSFDPKSLQKAEQMAAATDSSTTIAQALPPGVTLICPEGFLKTSRDSFIGQTIVRNGSLKAEGLMVLFPRVSSKQLSAARGRVEEAKAAIDELSSSGELKQAEKARKSASQGLIKAQDLEKKIAKDIKQAKKLASKVKELESDIADLEDELEKDEKAEVVRLQGQIRDAQIEFFTKHSRMAAAAEKTLQGINGLAVAVAKLGLASADAEKLERLIEPLKADTDRLTGELKEIKRQMAGIKEVFAGHKRRHEKLNGDDLSVEALQELKDKALTLAKKCRADRLQQEQGKSLSEAEKSMEDPVAAADMHKAIQDKKMDMDALNQQEFDGENPIERYEEEVKKLSDLEASEKLAMSKLDTRTRTADRRRKAYESKLDEAIHNVSVALTKSFDEIDCKGHVELVRDPDIKQWGAKIMVSFRASEAKQALSSTTHSGGERAVSTVSYLLALQKSTACPFRVVDEMNQGMDASNERAIFKQIMRTCGQDLSGTASASDLVTSSTSREGRQYFVITPKLLPDLEYEDHCRVHVILNGTHVGHPLEVGGTLYGHSGRTLTVRPGAGAGAAAGGAGGRGLQSPDSPIKQTNRKKPERALARGGRKRPRAEEEDEDDDGEASESATEGDEDEGSEEEEEDDDDDDDEEDEDEAASRGRGRRKGAEAAGQSSSKGKLSKRTNKRARSDADDDLVASL